MKEFETPRFVLTSFFTLTTTIAYFFTEKMTGDQYLSAMGVILTLYGATAITGVLKGKNNP